MMTDRPDIFDEELEGGETPRLGMDPVREKGWEVLESLRCV